MVTGGSGFIGTNLIRFLLQNTKHQIVNVDKLTYAGNLHSLSDVESNKNYRFEQIDIVDADAVERAFEYSPDIVMHLAAESHVDRSIDGPGQFIQTNIVGTFNLLHRARVYYKSLPLNRKEKFRFHHVSTDEVFGSLSIAGEPFDETTRYDPHSPYSASKASSDHLVRAWATTYGLPVLVTNCSNNYGPFQFPEKLVPVVILNAINGKAIPVYGNGEHIRDWLYVGDHVEALYSVIQKGTPGHTYNIGGNNEQSNIDVVRSVCRILDEEIPVTQNPKLQDSGKPKICKYEQLIEFVDDRPGHDLRYAINPDKIRSEIGWTPKENHENGFRKTVRWYLDNKAWWERILSGKYQLKRQGIVV